jgi:hypothetical protein
MQAVRTVSALSFAILTVAGPLRADLAGEQWTRVSLRWSGTYERDQSRGDADAAELGSPSRAMPRIIALERDGHTIALASDAGPKTVFDADGRYRAETGPLGERISSRAMTLGRRITITSSGNPASAFAVTLEPLDGGETLLMTRRTGSEADGDAETSRVYYRRIAESADWALCRERATVGAPRPGPLPARAFFRDDERLTATLETPLSSRTAKAGDRFSLTVQSPEELRGARVSGTVYAVREIVDGGAIQRDRKDIRVDFDTITLPGGRIASLPAAIEYIRLPDSSLLRVEVDDQAAAPKRGDAIGANVAAVIGVVPPTSWGGRVRTGTSGAIYSNTAESDVDVPAGSEFAIVIKNGD